MMDIILIFGFMITGLIGVIMLTGCIFSDMVKEEPRIWLPSLVISVICFIWLMFGCVVTPNYKTSVYKINTVDNTQVIKLENGMFVNINKKLGVVAKPNQMIEVKEITNHFRGGVYFITDSPEYKLITKTETK